MTLPDERSRAVANAQQFLFDLLDPKKTPKVPKAIRQRAGRILKHYPGVYYLNQSADTLPDIWGEVPKKEDQP